MDNVRLGITGLGNMGSAHATQVAAEKIAHCELAAVCDVDEAKLQRFDAGMRFKDAGAMFERGQVGMVLIAALHFSHVPLGTAGLHVLVEKPVAVHKADLAPATDGATSARRGVLRSQAQRVDRQFDLRKPVVTTSVAATDLSQSFRS